MTDQTDDHIIQQPGKIGARIAITGFGEAGQVFAAGWRDRNPAIVISAYDIKTDDADDEVVAAKYADYEIAGIKGVSSPAENLANADIVFSLVTAAQAEAAALATAPHIRHGAFYFDCNSCSPATKQRAAATVETAGGSYVDTAVMASVGPKLQNVPLLISSPHADAALTLLRTLGMNATLVRGEVGRASTIKMLRSVMVKGLEALTLECLLSARTAGVEDDVLRSLENSYPGFDWSKRSAHMLERSMRHGIRRAEEMREVAKTVAELKVPNDMTSAIVRWQYRVGEMKLTAKKSAVGLRADQILARLHSENYEE